MPHTRIVSYDATQQLPKSDRTAVPQRSPNAYNSLWTAEKAPARYRELVPSRTKLDSESPSPEAFAKLHDSLSAEWNPIGFTEDELVAELAGHLWQTQRVQTAQDQLGVNCARRLDALHRTTASLTGMLVRLQKRGSPRPLPAGATQSPTASSRTPFVRRKG